MTPEQFCYWLQGIMEYDTYGTPNDDQWKVIKDHLATVFVKVAPKMPPYTPPVYTPGPVAPLDGCRPIPSWPNRDIAIC